MTRTQKRKLQQPKRCAAGTARPYLPDLWLENARRDLDRACRKLAALRAAGDTKSEDFESIRFEKEVCEFRMGEASAFAATFKKKRRAA